MRNFEVKIFYSGYCTYNVDAENEEEAIIKAKALAIDNNELLSNLENWEEADTAEEIVYG
jgi:hypothetical protein